MDEQKLGHASPEWFALMVGAATDYAILSLDPEGMIVTWNRGAERMFQLPAEKAVGLPATFIFTPEDRAENEALGELTTAANEGRAQDTRWHMRADGTRFWASGVLMSIRDGDGVVRGFVKVIQDRTEEHRVEEQLRQSEERFARLVLQSPAGVAVELLTNHSFVFANEHFLRMTGFWRSEILGRSGEELGLWADPGQRASILEDVMREPLEGRRIDMRGKDGVVRPYVGGFQLSKFDERECIVSAFLALPDGAGGG